MATITEVPVVGGVTGNEAKIQVRTSEAATVKIRYADNASFVGAITTSGVLTAVGSDYTAVITLSSLSDNQQYYYRVLVDGVNQGFTNEFKTFPYSGSFKFAVFADVGNSDNPARAYKSASQDDILFALQIGDMNHADPQTLAAMREMHREMRDPAEVHGVWLNDWILSKMCFSHVWDDHDYGGNDEDKNFAGKVSALQAFGEYYPTYTRPNSAGIWYSFVCGDAEFFMLDSRSQRDPNTDTDDSNKSMLDGDNIANDQKSWLMDGLFNSSKTWKFILSPITFNDDARPNSNDLWRSFGTEAAELKDFIESNNIENVIVICGDLHTGGGIDDGTNSIVDLPEMTVPHTSLSSGNRKNKGTWSEGVTDGARGYGLVEVSANSVTLKAVAANGTVRHSYTL
jgi:alkaline phosphatase D